jgi:hypothetical protein
VHSNERLLLQTGARTARQKAQRAFAIEFLEPIDALREFVDGDFSDESVENAANYFGVRSDAVQRHLENNAPEFA